MRERFDGPVAEVVGELAGRLGHRPTVCHSLLQRRVTERSPLPSAVSSTPPPSHQDPPAPPRPHTPPTPGLDITLVHAEDHFVIVNKPAGMLSVPGRGEDKQDCARARVEQRFPDATGSITCHRLDMDTSGLLVMALDPVTHRKLSGQFEKRRVRKWYEALVEDHVTEPAIATDDDAPERVRIDLPQCVDWPNRPLQKIDFEHGKPGRTDAIVHSHETWTTPAGSEIDATRVELRPITGRTHQLRVHCAAARTVQSPDGPVTGGLAAPIIGDRLYGDETLAPRLLLHARRLGFWHPYSGDWVSFESPVPF